MLRAFLAAAIAVLCAPAVALAHGDPASHYLETGSLYPSFEHQPSQNVELQLIGVLDAAKKAGYPIKVSLVTAADVADTPEMLNKPQEYAEFVVGALVGSRVPVEAPVVIVTPAGSINSKSITVARCVSIPVAKYIVIAARPAELRQYFVAGRDRQ